MQAIGTGYVHTDRHQLRRVSSSNRKTHSDLTARSGRLHPQTLSLPSLLTVGHFVRSPPSTNPPQQEQEQESTRESERVKEKENQRRHISHIHFGQFPSIDCPYAQTCYSSRNCSATGCLGSCSVDARYSCLSTEPDPSFPYPAISLLDQPGHPQHLRFRRLFVSQPLLHSHTLYVLAFCISRRIGAEQTPPRYPNLSDGCAGLDGLRRNLIRHLHTLSSRGVNQCCTTITSIAPGLPFYFTNHPR